MLNHDPALVGGNGNAISKITYLWVANPFHTMDPATLTAMATAGMSEDLLAANTTIPSASAAGYCHMDVDPQQKNYTDFDVSRPCIPGIDYVRRVSDKHAAECAICVDNARQQGSGFFFYPHGSMSGHYQIPWPAAKNGSMATVGSYQMTIAPKAWFNELFGDGHAESRRADQLRMHWASVNPQVW